MRAAGRILRWLGIALGLLIVVLLAAFGVLQTQPGKSWLEKTVVQSVSSPDFAVTMQGLNGFVPLGLKVERIEIGDRDGTYLTLHDFGLDISAAAFWPDGCMSGHYASPRSIWRDPPPRRRRHPLPNT